MFDTHCHFYLQEDDHRLQAEIQEAITDGVRGFLVPGIDLNTSDIAIKLAQNYPGKIFAGVGIHPNYSHQAGSDDLEALIANSGHHVRAIGEIGLDFFRDYAPKAEQIENLKKMLHLAANHELPICLHNRNASGALLEILSHFYSPTPYENSKTGIFHAYDGSEAVAEWGLSHDFYFGIGGLVTYKKSADLREQVRKIGLPHLVLETDTPYLSPVPVRGKKNKPSNLTYVVAKLADILDESGENIIAVTTQNAQRILGLNKEMPG